MGLRPSRRGQTEAEPKGTSRAKGDMSELLTERAASNVSNDLRGRAEGGRAEGVKLCTLHSGVKQRFE